MHKGQENRGYIKMKCSLCGIEFIKKRQTAINKIICNCGQVSVICGRCLFIGVFKELYNIKGECKSCIRDKRIGNVLK